VLYLLVLTLFGGSAAAYAAFDRTVHISIDGHSRTVHTFARSVGAVLSRAHIGVGTHDDVTPSLSSSVGNHTRIDVARGRPLRLVIDGHAAVVWVTAQTVAQALQQLGLSNDGAFVSASISQPVPLSGMGFVVRMPHVVTILHDGTSTRITTNVPTVKRALAAARVRLRAHDRVSVALSSVPTDGEVITVTRVSTAHFALTLPIAFATERVATEVFA